jgi:hypothetical protein
MKKTYPCEACQARLLRQRLRQWRNGRRSQARKLIAGVIV